MNHFFMKIIRETLDWAIEEMQGLGGGFFSSQDADTEGEEGQYYLLNRDEILSKLSQKDAEIYSKVYDISEVNLDKKQGILHISKEPFLVAQELGLSEDIVIESLNRSRNLLRKFRENKVRPLTDDKILTAWNGMMVSALAKAYQVLGFEPY